MQHHVRAALAIAVVALGACANNPESPQQPSIAQTGSTPVLQTDTSTTGNSNGVVAGIRVSPRQITLPMGGSATLGALPVDARGVPTLAALSGPITWSVSDKSIATIGAQTGTIIGVAAGTTSVFATIGAFRDSAVVKISNGSDTVVTGGSGPTIPVTPPPPVASFTLTTFVFARGVPVTSGDTSTSVKFAGATVSVYRLSANAAVRSDSLTVRTLVQTAATDANGVAVFANLVSGTYAVTAQGLSDGALLTAESFVSPPKVNTVQIGMFLHK